MNASYAELLEDQILLLSETGQVLVRGRKAIAWQLLAVRDQGGCFTSTPGPDEQQYRFRLLDADCEDGLLFFARESSGATDPADADKTCITLSCTCVSGRAEFVIAGIEPVESPDGHAIRTAFPDVILLYQNRSFARVPVVSEAWLEWEFGTGHMTFRAQLIDVGLNGAGALLFEPGLCLDPGARLKARIVQKEQCPVAVDLEVRSSAPVLLADGRRAVRTGFQFLSAPRGLAVFLAPLGGDKLTQRQGARV
jgi:hypothetical protein